MYGVRVAQCPLLSLHAIFTEAFSEALFNVDTDLQIFSLGDLASSKKWIAEMLVVFCQFGQ